MYGSITPGKVSILIPSRQEIFLDKTIKDLLVKAKGEIEIIVVLDGYWPSSFTVRDVVYKQALVEDPRVKYIHRSTSQGMRDAINSAAQLATGEFLMKSDAHCMYDEGFDVKLKEDLQYYTENTDDKDDNWIVIPRRLRLDAENWCIREDDKEKPPIDYEYLSSPAGNGVKGNKWDDRTLARMDILIDETLSFQGSCWFMTRHHYLDTLGGMSEFGYGQFVREAQEIGLKTWLSGGRVFTNKKTWYAHLHKGPTYGRMYYIDKNKMIEGNEYCDDFWFHNRWDKARYDMAWLIERFAPVPTWTNELIEQVRKR